MTAPMGMAQEFYDEQLTADEDAARAQADAERRGALAAIYGHDFPLAQDTEPGDDDWGRWPEALWNRHQSTAADVLYFVERNRMFFREKRQWISARGPRGRWKEPEAAESVTRIVDDFVGPAMKWRHQVLLEQRPGFRFTPSSNADPSAKKKAEANQRLAESQWHRQKMQGIYAEGHWWAQTDGVAFLYTYWDPEAGPWDATEEMAPGDCGTKVYRIEQVRVSSEASATCRPRYVVIREQMPKAQAVALYGPRILDDLRAAGSEGDRFRIAQSEDRYRNPLFLEQDLVDRWLVFCDRSRFLPQGLELVVVGRSVVVAPRALQIGTIPLVRFTDGSEDPAYFPTPRCNDWVSPQQRLNVSHSKLIDSIRRNAGGNLISKEGAIVAETLVGGATTVLEVRSSGNVSDAVQPFTLGQAGKEAMEEVLDARKTLENLTGWNDAARGQFSSSMSGRAILAMREQLERTFAPDVQAASAAMAEWSKQTVLWARFGYQMPRAVGVYGANRADLANQLLKADDFDGTAESEVDPETLTPTPRSLKLYMLDDMYAKQLIGPDEMRRRYPGANLLDIEHADDVQAAKAQRIVDGILTGRIVEPQPGAWLLGAQMGQPVEPMRWQDDEAEMQDALDRHILLAADIPPEQVAVADALWRAYAAQSQLKTGGMPPAQMGGAPAAPGGIEPPTLPPTTAPIAGMRPPIAAAPGSVTDEDRNAGMFEATAPIQ